MSNDVQTDALIALVDLAREVAGPMTMTMLDIGSRPIEGYEEPFHKLLDLLPGSRIIGFDPGEDLGDSKTTEPQGAEVFFPVALGRANETRTFYETADPACSSLYKPDEELAKQYNALEVHAVERVTTLETRSMDDFLGEQGLTEVDFIKIDVQGAELDVFRGGQETLRNVIAIVSEVIFVPLYLGQPLFGDICEFLTEQEFMFHKFRGMAGRSLKPIVLNKDPHETSQHLWSDALFVRHILRFHGLSVEKLLKTAVFSFLYGSPDLAIRCLIHVDQKENANITERFLNRQAQPDADLS